MKGEVRCDDATRWLYASDASIYEIPPLAVVFPAHRAAVATAVEVCAAHGLSVHPRGAGTGLAGGCLGDGVVLDLSRHLTAVGPVDSESATVEVEPGVVLDRLNQAAAVRGLMFGPDPATASRCTLGGMIGTNASGAHSLLYGKTSDNVAAVSAVTADGREITVPGSTLDDRVATAVAAHATEIRHRFPTLQRRVAGYDLLGLVTNPAAGITPLLVGSEGTLAVTVSATLRLVSRPARRAIAVVCFDHPVEAMTAAVAALKLRPAAVEHIDRILLDQTVDKPGYAPLLSFLAGEVPASLLCIEFFGADDEEVDERMAALQAAFPGRRVLPLRGATEQANLWALRRAGLGLLMSKKGGAKPVAFMEDTAVPPEHLADYYAGVREILARRGLEASFYGHAGVGLLHLRPVLDLHRRADVAMMREVASEVVDLVGRFRGAVSGEHGDGLARSEWLERMYGPEIMAAFREVKALFDPRELLNPGKICGEPPPPMDERLRYDPTYSPILPDAPVQFQRDGDWLGAIEQCNGCGGCRKATGTMCPTFMATGDELLSTRGRANLYRAAAAGRLVDGLENDALELALATCLACKGCAAECPSGVDMALLKAAALHHRHRRSGTPLALRLLARPDRLGRWLAPVAPLANRLASNWLGRAIASRAGLDPRRALPPVSRHSFRHWFRRRGARSTGSRGEVLLWGDCFMEHFEPEIGRAAVAVLEAAGYGVRLIEHRCCGRPAYSQGLIDEVRDLAVHNVDALLPHVREGVPIICLEPSCSSMIGGDYRELLTGADVARVAGEVASLEGFLARLLAADPDALPLRRHPTPILLHPHCHSRATEGAEPALAVLRRLGTVADLDAGCCGMAGTFGYQKAHYDLSMQVGSRLAVRLEKEPHDRPVVASGTSCRHQIRQLTGRDARHIAALLADAIA
ncbi:MAG: FAD-linked oxidase C-terminal domain-containing protein [Nitrospirota bacterium]